LKDGNEEKYLLLCGMQKGRFTKVNITMIEEACKHLELNPETYGRSEVTYMKIYRMREEILTSDIDV